MFNWFDKMRREPLSKRRLVAFSLAILFTGVLFVLWLTVWLPGSTNQNNVTDQNDSFESPSSTFIQNFSSIWNGITKQYGQLQDLIKNVDVSENLSSDTQYDATSTAQSTTTQSTSKPPTMMLTIPTQPTSTSQ